MFPTLSRVHLLWTWHSDWASDVPCNFLYHIMIHRAGVPQPFLICLSLLHMFDVPAWNDHITGLRNNNLSLTLKCVNRANCWICSHSRVYAYDILTAGSNFTWCQFSIIICLIVKVAVSLSTRLVLLTLLDILSHLLGMTTKHGTLWLLNMPLILCLCNSISSQTRIIASTLIMIISVT